MPIAAEMYYFFHKGEERGAAPVVLIHGAGGNHLYWPSEIRRLRPYRSYTLDLPGHGKSGGRGMQSISAYAQSIIDWLAAVDLPGAVFVGHSMGSAIALALALDYPDQVLGLGLVGAGARLRVHPDILQNTASETTYQKAIDTIIRCAFSSSADSRLVELATRRMAETRPSVLHGDYLACDTFDVMERVANISQPSLVICGEDDQLTPVRYAQFLADRIPSAHLEVVPGAGHMVMLEQPAVVALALSNFLKKIKYP